MRKKEPGSRRNGVQSNPTKKTGTDMILPGELHDRTNPLQAAEKAYAHTGSPKRANLDQLKRDLQARVVTVSSFPIQMFLESVHGCAGKCIMCGDKPRTLTEFPADLFGKIESYFAYLKTLTIHGTGEALLGRNLDRYVDICKRSDCVLSLNANPTFLTQDRMEKILSTRLSIVFSVHASSPETYRNLMGDDFSRVKGKLTAFSEWNQKIGHKKNNVQLAFLVLKDNLDEIEDFLLFAKEVGLPQVKFMKLLPNDSILGEGYKREDSTYRFVYHEQFNEHIRDAFSTKIPRIRVLADELGIRIATGTMESCCSLQSNKQEGRAGLCIAPWVGQLLISQNGEVRLCCGMDEVLGNLYEQDLKTIWNSQRMKDIRCEFQGRSFPDACGDCPSLDIDKPEYDGAFESLW